MTAITPLRFVVAPSGFKESLTAEVVAGAIAAGLRRVVPGAVIDTVPLVDGGEGSARTLAAATEGRLVPVTVTGPVGDPVAAHFAVLGGDGPRTAFVEMAAAAGLRLVPRGARDPGLTTTRGVGELIRAALDEGCRRIVVGCGDSGTCDGGAGALTALGARVLGPSGEEVAPGGYALAGAVELDLSTLDQRLAGTDVLVACNPHNLLTGPSGVASVFGPQKGASAEQVAVLEAAMTRWAKLIEHRCGTDLRLVPGGGASGGLGAGLAGALGAQLHSRFDVLLDHTGLDDRLAEADLVITAEGAIDFQTPRGKVPAEVARRAKLFGKPVIALAGTIGRGARTTHDAGIDAYAGILAAPVPLAEAIEHAEDLVADATERALRLVLVGSALATAARVPGEH
ncbi:glycerate kinase [Prauserella sp. PE36]|uniref:Glycerate kinase n=1 Tax=Prauserella endophytica TaxID=1592324 RepID=A0ABY2RZJ3_9PSEU|nr:MULTISPECIES: glycerate kinase [Prauserella]RBM16915.1 glycerate kinase [Prauserella sp. PE36]TKG66697.1 glycerate kinase [Prauserella endophytica]